jgi:hypothetical protein
VWLQQLVGVPAADGMRDIVLRKAQANSCRKGQQLTGYASGMLQPDDSSLLPCFFGVVAWLRGKAGGAIYVYPTVHQVLSCMHMTVVWLGWAVYCWLLCMVAWCGPWIDKDGQLHKLQAT